MYQIIFKGRKADKLMSALAMCGVVYTNSDGVVSFNLRDVVLLDKLLSLGKMLGDCRVYRNGMEIAGLR